MEIWPGLPYPMGAIWDGHGTNFTLFSEVAERVELCLFDEQDREQRVDLPEVTAYTWHGYLPTIGPGQRYGFRVHGPWDPSRGHRSNPAKLLLDPYARAIEGHMQADVAILDYLPVDPDQSRNDSDSAPFVPRSVVVDPSFDWGDDRPLRRPMHESIIYELHVKGFTRLHPAIPEKLRGTFAGLAHPSAIEYLQGLGITAVELLPVHQFVDELRLLRLGLRNYWGYNTIGFLAPHNGYAATGQRGEQVREFQGLVKALHQAGLEVILDVVYNHTGEGDHLGPSLSFSGIDNASYYRLIDGDRRRYRDYTGTGNSLNARHPQVLALIMDSLRYWVQEMHVDGFRFDLASTLARVVHNVDQFSGFFNLIHQDPVIRQVKLIAEPWDVGEGGYQIGLFPPVWSEWNGKYRDTVRRFWRGDEGRLGRFATRFAGSADLYARSGRRPRASINFVTCHDGFTLRDLCSYEQKRNLANGQDNQDGESLNYSCNCGVEGPTEDGEVTARRSRQARSLLATLLLSQGVPMLLAGDEAGHTQRGNNNAYCQDNEISWLDWEHQDTALVEFVRRLIRLRREHPVFRRRQWLTGTTLGRSDLPDVGWFAPSGSEMTVEHWDHPGARAVAVLLNGDAIAGTGFHGEAVVDGTFLVLFNAGAEPLDFVLPAERWGRRWEAILSTATPSLEGGAFHRPGDGLRVEARSVVLLLCHS